MLLRPEARQVFVDLEYAGDAVKRMNVSSRCCVSPSVSLLRYEVQYGSDDQFLAARILFLLTYGTTLDLNTLNAKNNLAEAINDVGRFPETASLTTNPQRLSSDMPTLLETTEEKRLDHRWKPLHYVRS